MKNILTRTILLMTAMLILIMPAYSDDVEITISPEDLETFILDEKRFGGGMAEGGAWVLESSVTIEDTLEGTQILTVSGSIDMQSPGLAYNTHRNAYKGIFILLMGERTFDENGAYSYGRDVLSSTYLTDTGLPVEGFERGLPSDIFGGNTRHPINKMIVIPPNELSVDLNESIINGEFNITMTIDHTQIPPGHYLISLLPGIQLDDTNFVTLRNDDPAKEEVSRDSRAISIMGLIPTGKPKPPRLPWVILPDHIDGGVVAKEDSDSFATTKRTNIKPVAIIPPVDPNGSQIRYRLEPALPYCLTNNFSPIAMDFSTGEFSVRIRTPQKHLIDLGSASVTDLDGIYLSSTNQDRFTFAFSFYGKHEIEVTGTIKDRNGLEIHGGGVYEVYVAKPLELRTVIKPGLPLGRNEIHDLALNVIPPVPAKISVEQTFNPWSRKGDVNRNRFSISCNQFGIYSPKESILRRRYTMTENIRYTSPGEYRIDLIAEYRDDKGVLYMGSQTLAGIVFEKQDLLLRGEDPARRKVYPYGNDVFTVPQTPDQILAFPENHQLIFDPDLRVVLKDDLLKLGILRGEKTHDLPGGEIGILPRSTAMINPAHFYPERIDRKMYSYISAVTQDGRTLFVVKDGVPMTEDILDNNIDLNLREDDFLNIYGSMIINDSSLRKREVHYGFIATAAVPSRDIDQPQNIRISDGNIPVFTKDTPFFHSFTFHPGTVIERNRHFIPRFHIFPPVPGIGKVTLTYPNGEKTFVYMEVDERGFAWTNPDNPPELWQEGINKAHYTFFPHETDIRNIDDNESGIGNVEFPFFVIRDRKENKLAWHLNRGSVIATNKELILNSVIPSDTFVEGSAHFVASFNGELIWQEEVPFDGNAFSIAIPVPQIIENIRNLDLRTTHDVIDIGCFVKGVNAKGDLQYMAGRILLNQERIHY